jgi:hypothetical protein
MGIQIVVLVLVVMLLVFLFAKNPKLLPKCLPYLAGSVVVLTGAMTNIFLVDSIGWAFIAVFIIAQAISKKISYIKLHKETNILNRILLVLTAIIFPYSQIYFNFWIFALLTMMFVVSYDFWTHPLALTNGASVLQLAVSSFLYLLVLIIITIILKISVNDTKFIINHDKSKPKNNEIGVKIIYLIILLPTLLVILTYASFIMFYIPGG